jgi:hypothetical protein
MKYQLQLMPTLTANDDEIILVNWFKGNGEFIQEKEVVCEIERYKSGFRS